MFKTIIVMTMKIIIRVKSMHEPCFLDNSSGIRAAVQLEIEVLQDSAISIALQAIKRFTRGNYILWVPLISRTMNKSDRFGNKETA